MTVRDSGPDSEADDVDESRPLDLRDASTVPGERIIDKPELPKRGLVMHMEADTQTMAGKAQLKVGQARGFTVYSDEPPQIGGTEEYPPPMAYMALGIGFCLLTQLARYAHMMKIPLERATCHVDLHYSVSGSVLAGTVHAIWQEVRTRLHVEADAPPERVAALVRNAKGGCTAEAMAAQAVPIRSEVILNGSPLRLEAEE